MNVFKKLLIAAGIVGALSLFGCGQNAPQKTKTVAPPSSQNTRASKIPVSDVRELARLLPEFIDSLQHPDGEDESDAALAMLAALRQDENSEVMQRNATRITWAATVNGAERLKQAALLARDVDKDADRSAAFDNLADLLRLDEVNNRTDAVLEKIADGQTPTEQEIAVLAVAAEIMRSEPPDHGEE